MKSRLLSFAFPVAMMLTSCQPGLPPLSGDDIADLHQMRDSHVQAAIADDCNAAYAMFAEDVVYLVPAGETVEGRAGMIAHCEAGLSAGIGTQDFAITSLGIDGNGDMAYDVGVWSRTLVSEGVDAPTVISGKYMMIARKQADGSWLWTMGITNLDQPPPQTD